MLLMKKNGIKFNLWDPLISEQDHKELNNLNLFVRRSFSEHLMSWINDAASRL